MENETEVDSTGSNVSQVHYERIPNVIPEKEIWEFEYLEEKILCTAMSNKTFFLTLFNHVERNEFSNDICKRIFDWLKKFYAKRTYIASMEMFLTIIKKFELNEEKQALLIKTTTNIFNPDFVSPKERIDIIRDVDNWIKRNKIKKALILSIDLMQRNKFDEILKEIKDVVKFSSKLETGKELTDNIAERYMKLTDSNNVITTFSPTLNVYLEGGFHRGELYIMMAGSGFGKSAFLINEAIWCMKQGMKVVYVTLELSEDQVKFRMDKSAFGYTTEELHTEWKSLDGKYQEILKTGGRLKVVEAPALTYTDADLRRYLDQLKNQEDFCPDVVLFDYLEKAGVSGGSSQMKEYEKQGVISDALRNVGVEYNLAMVTATQANKRVFEIDDPEKPIPAELAIGESLQKYKVSDGFFVILQTKSERENDNARILIMKNRHGEVNTQVSIKTYYNKMKFEEAII